MALADGAARVRNTTDTSTPLTPLLGQGWAKNLGGGLGGLEEGHGLITHFHPHSYTQLLFTYPPPTPHWVLIHSLPEHLVAPEAESTRIETPDGLIPRGETDRQAPTTSDGVTCASKDREHTEGTGSPQQPLLR